MIIVVRSQKYVLFRRKLKASVFQFLQFEECFRQPPLSGRISVDGRRNRRNNPAFSDFYGLVWTGRPQILKYHLRLYLHMEIIKCNFMIF